MQRNRRSRSTSCGSVLRHATYPLAVACVLTGSAAAARPAAAQVPRPVQQPVEEAALVPSAAALMAATSSELRDAVERYDTDRSALLRRYDAPYSADRRDRLAEFYDGWLRRLKDIPFERLDQEARIDYVLLRNELTYQRGLLEREARDVAEMQALLPFAESLGALQLARRGHEPIEPQAVAAELARIARQIEDTRARVEAGLARAPAANGSGDAMNATDAPIRTTRIVAFRAARAASELQRMLERWHRFYAGYDPLFTWWATQPYERVDAALESYIRVLRERVVGIRPDQPDPIIGDPIGAEGLKADLAYEMIPYTPAELVEIARREFEWCEAEARRAARDLGFGDDWNAALEKVKTLHVAPGEQTALTLRLAREAVEFVESRDLVTIPPLAKEVWRMEMLSPEQQRVAPFYLGGEVIQVSFPTDEMTHEDKMMSMRGNNVHFSRAVVHHELIPGHHLQQFMSSRYNPHRRNFSTPFWTEGWALYWEMLLWDLGFPQTPEDRVGMLFWRMHRAARIVFSLSIHLGTMTPEEAIDYLVERVGHERANAEAEVRRSLNGSYSPLYQAAYMLGGLQFRALHEELVGGGRMTNPEFHDAILQGGTMPVEMVRARLLGTPLTRDYTAQWRFADGN